MKNTLERINSRLGDTEECISDLEDRITKSPNQTWKKKPNLKNENNLREHWDTIKCTNIHIIGVPDGEVRQKGVENLFDEIMAENFLNLNK